MIVIETEIAVDSNYHRFDCSNVPEKTSWWWLLYLVVHHQTGLHKGRLGGRHWVSKPCNSQSFEARSRLYLWLHWAPAQNWDVTGAMEQGWHCSAVIAGKCLEQIEPTMTYLNIDGCCCSILLRWWFWTCFSRVRRRALRTLTSRSH